jgi:hypothetical protein
LWLAGLHGSNLSTIVDTPPSKGSFANAAGMGHQAANHAAKIMLDARRKAGDTLRVMKERGELAEGRIKLSQHARVTLDDLGLTYSQSSRYQQEASVPEDAYAAWASGIMGDDEPEFVPHGGHFWRPQPPRSAGKPLESARALKRRKAIYLELHPETAQHVAGAIGSNIAQGNATDKMSVASDAPSFAKDTAEKTGKTERQVRRDVAIGENLSQDAAEVLKDTPTADNKSELDRRGVRVGVGAQKKHAEPRGPACVPSGWGREPERHTDYAGRPDDPLPPGRAGGGTRPTTRTVGLLRGVRGVVKCRALLLTVVLAATWPGNQQGQNHNARTESDPGYLCPYG